MFKVYTKEDEKEWNEIVKSFENWDIYYTYEYAYSFMLHGDGEPLLIYYQEEQCRFCYVMMKNDIAKCNSFQQKLSENQYYDMETPYGYGGPLVEGVISDVIEHNFWDKLFAYCKENGIVSQFFRYHPLLQNWNSCNKMIDSRYLRDTIYIDTTSADIIWSNLDSKNRNMIRKAQKNGVVIKHMPISEYQAFLPLYEKTMNKNCADDYYYFSEAYFKYLSNMEENACYFYAVYDDKVISGSIMFYNQKYMHYHLSGSDINYRNLAASNLLLYEASLWACEKGIKQFHLGGGISPDDNLFGFKKQFNRKDRGQFYVGRTIFDKEKYEELLDIRKTLDNEFDKNNGFMIQYRR